MLNPKMTDYDIDMLCEIGNIGAGHAASALSVMLNQKISIEVTFAQLCGIKSIPYLLSENDEVKNVTYNEIYNALNGYIFFILNDRDIETICNIAAHGVEIDNESVITEVTNIITGSYINALSDMLDESVDQRVPRLKKEKLSTLINYVIGDNMPEMADQTVLIGTNLIIKDIALGPDLVVKDFHISGLYVMMLKQNSLEKLIGKFNADRK